ncbi:MAG: hypothetical protein ABUK01_18475 [Leptospirales bacterium]
MRYRFKYRHTYLIITLGVLFSLHCGLNMEEKETSTVTSTAIVTVNSLNPPEYSLIDNHTRIFFDLDYSIKNYDSNRTYEMVVYLYDTNSEVSYGVYIVPISTATGNINDSFSSIRFYNCIFSCVRRTALPFRMYFKIDDSNSAGAIGESREYNYNEL